VGVDDAEAVGFADGVGCGVSVGEFPLQPAKKPTIAQRKKRRMRFTIVPPVNANEYRAIVMGGASRKRLGDLVPDDLLHRGEQLSVAAVERR
jgi:hypothetical protein